jgi:hypothetical protein
MTLLGNRQKEKEKGIDCLCCNAFGFFGTALSHLSVKESMQTLYIYIFMADVFLDEWL